MTNQSVSETAVQSDGRSIIRGCKDALLEVGREVSSEPNSADWWRNARCRLPLFAIAGLVAGCTAANDTETVPCTSVVIPFPSSAPTNCPASRKGPANICCPEGQAYGFESRACVPMGPRGCEYALDDPTAECVPTWCFDPTADHSAYVLQVAARENWPTCDGPIPTAASLCPAGTYRLSPTDPECREAGAFAESAEFLSQVPLDEPLSEFEFSPTMPPGGPAPSASEMEICRLSDGQMSLCPAGSSECGPGKMPDPESFTACIDIGVPWECPPGFAQAASDFLSSWGPRNCIPKSSDCVGLGQLVAEYPGAIIVTKAPSALPDGAKVFENLQQAVAASSAGDMILVDAGKYELSAEISHALTIRGICAASVEIAGSGTSPIIQAKSTATVKASHISVNAPSRAIAISGTAEVEIADSLIRGTSTPMVSVQGKASAVMNRVVVSGPGILGYDDNAPSEDGALHLRDSATLSAKDIAIAGWPNAGVHLHPNTSLRAERLLIEHTFARPGTGYEPWVGGLRTIGAHAVLRSATLIDNRRGGILAVDSKVDAAGLVVELTDGFGQLDDTCGAIVHGATALDLRAARISGNFHIAILAFNDGLKPHLNLNLEAALIVGNNDGSLIIDQSGVVQTNAKVQARSVRITNLAGGIAWHVISQFSALDARDVRIDSVKARAVDSEVGGIIIQGGANVTLADFVVHSTTFMAIQVSGSSLDDETRLLGERILVNNVTSQPGKTNAGYGMAVEGNSRVELHATRIHGVRNVGAFVTGAQAKLRLVDSSIAGVAPKDSDGRNGFGAIAVQGAELTLQSCVVQETANAGVHAEDALTAVALTSCLVSDTGLTSPSAGVSAINYSGGTLLLEDCRIIRPRGRGLMLDNDVSSEARATMLLRRLKIEDVLPYTVTTDEGVSYEFGPGILVGGGVDATVQELLVEGATGVGLGLPETNTKIAGWGVKVARTHSTKPSDSLLDLGVGVSCPVEGNLIALFGSDVSDSGTSGFALSGTDAELTGCLIASTRPSEVSGQSGGYAAALVADGSLAKTRLYSSLIDYNAGIGALIAGGEYILGSVAVQNTSAAAVFGTLDAENEDFPVGDGVVVRGGTGEIVRCLLRDNFRAGLRLDGGEFATLAQSIVTGNQFGVELVRRTDESYQVASTAAHIHSIDNLIGGNESTDASEGVVWQSSLTGLMSELGSVFAGATADAYSP